MTLREFQDLIVNCKTKEELLLLVQKYLFHGTPFVFNNRENEYFEFRNRIAHKFNVGFNDVFIVGSAKLGFSYLKCKPFDYDSDIDIVIVNEKLFEKFYFKITEYQYQLDSSHITVDQKELNIYFEFLKYLVKGWMRPDKLPTSFQVNLLKSEWFDFFESLSYGKSEVGDYKVAAGLYKNYEYLENYHKRTIENVYKSLTKI